MMGDIDCTRRRMSMMSRSDDFAMRPPEAFPLMPALLRAACKEEQRHEISRPAERRPPGHAAPARPSPR